MSKWNPADHLPECGVTAYPICICDRLRACEQRVRTEDDDYAYIAAQAEAEGRMRGWNEALDAAREAVMQALGPMDCEDPDQYLTALAAIDALKEKP